MASLGQNAPLPPGWEAKYDPSSQRYFFINHATKETTWTDPRTTYNYPRATQPTYNYPRTTQPTYNYPRATQPTYQYNQQAAQQATQQAAQQMFNGQQQQQATSHAVSFQLQDRSASPQHSEPEEETTLNTSQLINDDTVSASAKANLLAKVKKNLDLEGVTDDLIITTMDAGGYDYEAVISIFNGMGFHKKGERPKPSSTSTTNRWDVGTSKPRSRPPHSRTTESSSATTSSLSTSAAGANRGKAKADKKSTTAANTAAGANRGKAKADKKSTTAANTAASGSTSDTTPKKATTKKTVGKPKKTTTTSSTSSSSSKTLEDVMKNFNLANTDINSVMNKMSSTTSVQPMSSNASVSLHALFNKKNSDIESIFKNRATTTKTTASALSGQSNELVRKLKPAGRSNDLVVGSNASKLRMQRLSVKGRDGLLAVGAKRGLAKGHSIQNCGRQVKVQGADKSLCIGPNTELAKGVSRGIMV